MTEVTILDKLKSNDSAYSVELAAYIKTSYPDSILSIAQDAIKADLERKEDKFQAAALRMVGVVNKAVYNAGQRFLSLDEGRLHSTAIYLFDDAVGYQRYSFGAETDRGFQDLYPVASAEQYCI